MSWFMAAVYDWFMRDLEEACAGAWRKDLLGSLRGDVLEVGTGTGRNLDHYPKEALGRLVLAEPDPHMRKKLEARAQGERFEIVSWTAERLDTKDASFDVVVSTLVLCSVADAARSLAEIRRVLRPGGKLVFLEHVISDDLSRRRWQRRLEPLWSPIAGNCHLTRDTESAIASAGFRFERIVREDARKMMPLARYMIRGVATRD